MLKNFPTAGALSFSVIENEVLEKVTFQACTGNLKKIFFIHCSEGF